MEEGAESGGVFGRESGRGSWATTVVEEGV
jgi:hypothetical protein